MRQFDRNTLAATLKQGADALGVGLNDAQLAQLLDYLALLAKWNAVYNLTSVRDPMQMVTHHLLDTLAAAYVPTDGTLTDDTVKDGLLGDQLRVKLIVVGTYAASSLAIYAETG